MSLFVLLFHISASAQQQVQVEYWVDSDPGLGFAQQVSATIGNDGNVSFEAATAGLAPGCHVLGFRAYIVNETGNIYGPTLTQNFIVPNTDDNAQISRVEYFWDDDPGYGEGTPIAITSGTEVNLQGVEVSADGLTPGVHLLGLRAYGNGGWGPTIRQEVMVSGPEVVATITLVEYFWDGDPGYGEGTPIAITSGTEVNLQDVEVSADDLTPGAHLLGLRAYGNGGWGPTLRQEVMVTGETVDAEVEYVEYFWNEDPGYGNGTAVSITPGTEVSIDNLQIPTYEIHGDAILFIRGRGTEGWGPTLAYAVMVDAEGNYTLNAQAETSAAERNYQSLGEALDDFADRGVGNDITLTIPTANTTYELDATTEERLQQLAAITTQMSTTSTARHQKIISFTAAEGSGNSVSVSTTDAGLPTIMAFFAQTAWQNVALTINGGTYDFTPASQRKAEICSGETTEAVSLSSINSSLTAHWTAQPHAGTSLMGYTQSGEGDLTAMTISNSAATIDSIAYQVTLTDGQQRELCSYTYFIYVHASLANQAFSGLQPADGSSLDPGTTTLRWNAIGDAQGYTVTLSRDGGEPQTIETTDTHCEVDVESGATYTWSVTAVGACDNLVSPTMTFNGRLLPDLVVETIIMPEAAEAENTITITATVKNQGQGTTTETTWRDRLYYVIDSQDFKQAVEADNVVHTGALEAGAAYTVEFSLTIPAVETGELRVFVETDTEAQVLETDDTNNRTLSAAATLRPFYMNTADLAVLRQLYTDFGGNEWNGTQWNTASELIKEGNWSGVTFDVEGRVTSINLQGRGLTGSLSEAAVLALPKLATLNMSRNALKGDPALFITATGLPLITSLDLSYNQIDNLSAPLPSSITTLRLGWQHRNPANSYDWPGLDQMTAAILNIGNDMTVDGLPTLAGYDHAAQTLGNHPQLQIFDRSYNHRGNLVWNDNLNSYAFQPSNWKQTDEQDADMLIEPAYGHVAEYSAWPAKLHFLMGDANLSGWVDVNDVQRTLNYVLDYNNNSTFGVAAANTFSEGETDVVINIQDIVCTVNIVLENENDEAAGSRHKAPLSPSASISRLSVDGCYVTLDAVEPLAAFCIELNGVNQQQVKLLLSQRDWQMQTRPTAGGLRLLVFSPTGQTLPLVSGTQLLRLGATAEIVSAEGTSPEAEPVGIAIGSSTTRVSQVDFDATSDNDNVYDLGGRPVIGEKAVRRQSLYIKNGKKVRK